jgi:hypothetical protein
MTLTDEQKKAIEECHNAQIAAAKELAKTFPHLDVEQLFALHEWHEALNVAHGAVRAVFGNDMDAQTKTAVTDYAYELHARDGHEFHG